MRTTVVLKDDLVAKARELSKGKTLSGLLNSCLADRIAQHSRKEIETRLADEYHQGCAESRRVSHDFAAVVIVSREIGNEVLVGKQRAHVGREADSVEHLVDPRPDRARERSVWIWSGSAMMSSTRMRGLKELTGSWDTTCTARR